MTLYTTGNVSIVSSTQHYSTWQFNSIDNTTIRFATVSYPGDVSDSDDWGFFLTVQAHCFLFSTILRLEQVVVARRPLIITLTISDNCRETFTHQCLGNVSATEFTRFTSTVQARCLPLFGHIIGTDENAAG